MKILCNYFGHIHTLVPSFSQTHFYLSTPKFISLMKKNFIFNNSSNSICAELYKI